MNLFTFMDLHPYISFFIACLICNTIFRSWNRFMRHLNIRAHGWPPEHCDADGDFKLTEENETN